MVELQAIYMYFWFAFQRQSPPLGNPCGKWFPSKRGHALYAQHFFPHYSAWQICVTYMGSGVCRRHDDIFRKSQEQGISRNMARISSCILLIEHIYPCRAYSKGCMAVGFAECTMTFSGNHKNRVSQEIWGAFHLVFFS